jgi:hypothetical protein
MQNPTPPALAPEISINRGAGRGDALFLQVRVGGGEALPFGVDTGAPYTLLDKSLEPRLGHRVSSRNLRWVGGYVAGATYQAPILFLGDVQLRTGPRVAMTDLSKFGYPRPLMGILGMDCLRHYCIQLDFAASKCRFLDSANLDTQNLGHPFPLLSSRGCFAVRQNLVTGDSQGSTIDTGCNFDGMLTPHLFQQWTNHNAGRSGFSDCAHSPNGRFAGETYTKLDLHMCSVNVLGLSFLSRHLVTLNFPKSTMYLKRVSVGPLPKEWPSAWTK